MKSAVNNDISLRVDKRSLLYVLFWKSVSLPCEPLDKILLSTKYSEEKKKEKKKEKLTIIYY